MLGRTVYQCPGAAPATDRKTVSTINDIELTELYNDLDRYEELQGEMNERAIDLTRRAEQAEATLAFVTRVLELFSLSHADLYDGGLFWRVENGELKLFANVSDVFAWGGADAEPITPDTLPALEQAYVDLKAVDADEFTAELYAARQRGERPQGAAYPDSKHKSWRQVSALYDACGPERPIGLGNPKKAHAHKETTT